MKNESLREIFDDIFFVTGGYSGNKKTQLEYEQQIREHFADRVLSVKQIADIIWKWIRDNDAVDKSCKITLSPEEDLEYIAKVIHKEAQKKRMGKL